MTGGRIKRIAKYVGDEPFLLTYGDGVSDVNILETLEQHKAGGRILTMTTYQPSGKLGVVEIEEDGKVSSFLEKPTASGSWINAGFFVCEPKIFDYLQSDHEMFEREPMQRLLKDGEINAYRHYGFWKPMDTLHDNKELNQLWDTDKAPWKIW